MALPLEQQQALAEYEMAQDEWRKNLGLGVSTIVSTAISGAQGGGGGATTPGPTGAQGAQGTQGQQGEPGPIDNVAVNVWIAIRTDGKVGTGAANDPYHGYPQSTLDDLLRSFPQNTHITFGPGVFLTQGRGAGVISQYRRWSPKDGWKIKGSGVGVTTLRLVDADIHSINYAVIGDVGTSNPIDSVEISDLTIDCNWDGQPGLVNCGAIDLYGSNILLRRLHVVNWGSTIASGFLELFVVHVAGGHYQAGDERNCIIDDVRIDQPGSVPNPPITAVTMLAVGGSNNYKRWDTCFLAKAGSEVTAEIFPADAYNYDHNLTVGAYFRIRNASHANYNGSHLVTEVVDGMTVKFEVDPATPDPTGSAELEHDWNPTGLGVGWFYNALVRNCYLDGAGLENAAINGVTMGGCVGGKAENLDIRNVDHGFYMDTWRGNSLAIRNCYISSVETGILFSLGQDANSYDFLAIEQNSIVLLPLISRTSAFQYHVTTREIGATPIGIALVGVRDERPLTYRSAVIRGNLVRFTEPTNDPDHISVAIRVSGAEQLAVLDNLIDLVAANQMATNTIDGPVLKVTCRGNRDSQNQIIRVFDQVTGKAWFDPDVDRDKVSKLAQMAY